MSDGITESYRAGRASNQFEQIWKLAQADQILLDAKSLIIHLSVEELMDTLTEICPSVRIQTADKYEIQESWGTDYRESVCSAYVQMNKCPLIRFYTVEISCKTHRRFTSRSLIDSLREALLFAEWTETDEGKRAVEISNDY